MAPTAGAQPQAVPEIWKHLRSKCFPAVDHPLGGSFFRRTCHRKKQSVRPPAAVGGNFLNCALSICGTPDSTMIVSHLWKDFLSFFYQFSIIFPSLCSHFFIVFLSQGRKKSVRPPAARGTDCRVGAMPLLAMTVGGGCCPPRGGGWPNGPGEGPLFFFIYSLFFIL